MPSIGSKGHDVGGSVGLSASSASRNLGGMKLVYAGAILADDGRDSSLFLKGADGTKNVQKKCFWNCDF